MPGGRSSARVLDLDWCCIPSIADIAAGYRSTVPTPFLVSEMENERGDLETQMALERALSERDFRTRTLPAIFNRAAARGSFRSGQTTLRAGQAQEDMQRNLGRSEYELQKRLADLTRGTYLNTVGIRL